MTLQPTALDGLQLAAGAPYTDARGAFARLYCERELADAVGERRIVQVNHSRTAAKGAVRGLHFQHAPHAEMKLVRCLRGRVYDVAVDLRAGSPTFLRWHAQELSPENGLMMVIPEGYAHGFQVLEPDSELLYLHTSFYTPGAEGGLHCQDPSLAIRWPLPVGDLSPRDQSHPLLTPEFSGIVL